MKRHVFGQTLIEILIIIALLAMLLPVLIGGLITSREGRPQQLKRALAAQKIRETKEAMRSIREAGWNNISINGTYHVTHDGVSWALSSGSHTENGITTQVVISDVRRDSSHTIVALGGSIDPSTKKIAITTSWLSPIPTNITSTLYLTRHLDNATYIQTTEEDFNTGSHDGTNVVNNDGGEVVLGAGGQGNWCEPGDAVVAELDYPGNAEARAVTAIEGRVFMGTGQNASGLPFGHVAVSNDNPPVPQLVGTYSNISPPKSNGVFGESNYAYIATEDNNREISIINLTTNPYSEIGYFNPSGNLRGISVFVAGNVGYMTTSSGNSFRSFNLSSKSGSRPQLGQVSLAGVGNSIYIQDNYAYVAVNSSSTQLQIIDISNPSSPQIVSSRQLSNTVGRDVYVNETGTRAYVVTANSGSNPEFFIVDITNKSNPSVVSGGTYDTGAMSPTGVRVVPGGRAIIVGESGGERYQVLNINNENNPNRCGGLNVPHDIYGIDAVLEGDGDAYSYIVTADSNAEFKIIEGGPGGQYTSSGVYESETFDLGYGTAFNRFIPTFILPPNTSLQFQISIVDPVAGSCSGVTHQFTGPDGTENTYYTTVEPIAFDNNDSGYENPGRCFRYRAYFETSDSSSTPIFEEVTVNYSP